MAKSLMLRLILERTLCRLVNGLACICLNKTIGNFGYRLVWPMAF